MPVSARERGSSRYNGRKHSGRGAWKKIEGILLQATIVQPKTYLIMKARVYLSLGALLLFLAPLGCSDKAESPAPETPPEEQPVQPSEEYKEMYHSMEDNIKDEEPSLYYTYFRMRNASDQPLYIAVRARMNPYGFFYYLKPKEQATHWRCTENCAGLNFDMDQVLIKDLNKGLTAVEIYYRDDKAGTLGPEKDTAMLYNFIKPMTEEMVGTPRDPARWEYEEFPDRPRAVRWTIHITNEDYEEAVRATTERWKEWDRWSGEPIEWE